MALKVELSPSPISRESGLVLGKFPAFASDPLRHIRATERTKAGPIPELKTFLSVILPTQDAEGSRPPSSFLSFFQKSLSGT